MGSNKSKHPDACCGPPAVTLETFLSPRGQKRHCDDIDRDDVYVSKWAASKDELLSRLAEIDKDIEKGKLRERLAWEETEKLKKVYEESVTKAQNLEKSYVAKAEESISERKELEEDLERIRAYIKAEEQLRRDDFELEKRINNPKRRRGDTFSRDPLCRGLDAGETMQDTGHSLTDTHLSPEGHIQLDSLSVPSAMATNATQVSNRHVPRVEPACDLTPSNTQGIHTQDRLTIADVQQDHSQKGPAGNDGVQSFVNIYTPLKPSNEASCTARGPERTVETSSSILEVTGGKIARATVDSTSSEGVSRKAIKKVFTASLQERSPGSMTPNSEPHKNSTQNRKQFESEQSRVSEPRPAKQNVIDLYAPPTAVVMNEEGGVRGRQLNDFRQPSLAAGVEPETVSKQSAQPSDFSETPITDKTDSITEITDGQHNIDQEITACSGFPRAATKDPSSYYRISSSKQSYDVVLSEEGRKRNRSSSTTTVRPWTSLKSRMSIFHGGTKVSVGDALEFNMVDESEKPLITYGRVLHIKAYRKTTHEHPYLLHILYYYTREEAFAEKIPNLLQSWPKSSPCTLILSNLMQIVSINNFRAKLDLGKLILEGKYLNCIYQTIRVEDGQGDLVFGQRLTDCTNRFANFESATHHRGKQSTNHDDSSLILGSASITCNPTLLASKGSAKDFDHGEYSDPDSNPTKFIHTAYTLRNRPVGTENYFIHLRDEYKHLHLPQWHNLKSYRRLPHEGMTVRVGDFWWSKKNIAHAKPTRLLKILCIKKCEKLPCPAHIFGLMCYDIEDATERSKKMVSGKDHDRSGEKGFDKEAWPKQYMVTNHLQLASIYTLVRKLETEEQEKIVCNLRMFEYSTAEIKSPDQIPWASRDGYKRWEARRRKDENPELPPEVLLQSTPTTDTAESQTAMSDSDTLLRRQVTPTSHRTLHPPAKTQKLGEGSNTSASIGTQIQIDSRLFKIAYQEPGRYDIESLIPGYLEWKYHKSLDFMYWQTRDKAINVKPDSFIKAWDYASARVAKVLHIKEGSSSSSITYFHILWCYSKKEADHGQIVDEQKKSLDPTLSYLSTRMDIIPTKKIIDVLTDAQVPNTVCQFYVIDWDRKKYMDVESTDRSLDWITPDNVAARFGS